MCVSVLVEEKITGLVTQDRSKNMDQKITDAQFSRLSEALKSTRLPYIRVDKKEGFRRGYADEFMLMSFDSDKLRPFARFKHRGTRNYVKVMFDGSLDIPIKDEDFLRGDFGSTPYDSREASLARINALDLTTSDTDVDDPSYGPLCDMLRELLESCSIWLCPGSLKLQTHSGRRDRCPECGEFRDTWDQKYISYGGDELWGDILEAHAHVKSEVD